MGQTLSKGDLLTDIDAGRVSLTKWSIWALASIATITLIVYVIVFTMSPLSGEDFALTRQFGSETFLERISWVVDRSVEQSSTWNARLGEQLSIFWLSMPKVFFTLVATAAFLLLIFLSATSITGFRHLFVKVTLSIALIFAFWPGMEVFFWGTANAGYLQPMLILLSCMYLYRSESSLSRLRETKFLSAGVVLLAFLGGLSFENAPVAVIAYMAISLFLQGRQHISLWTIAPIASMALGWVLLLAAPSTALRSQYYKDARGLEGYSIDYLLARFVDVVSVFTSTALPLLIAALVSCAYLFMKRKFRLQVSLMLGTAILVVASVMAAPYTEPRAFLLAWALLLTIAFAGLFEFMSNHRVPDYLLIGACVLALYFPLTAITNYADFASISNAREAHILAEQDRGNCADGVRVDRITKQYPYKYLNNRDIWYAANDTGYVSDYYLCKVLVQ